MRKILSQTFSTLSAIAAIGMVVAVLWYVFGDLPNLLPKEFLSEFGVASPIFRWLFGLAAYMVVGTLTTLLFLAASRIVLVGWVRFLEEEQEKSSRAKKEAIREAGTLIAISIDSGGLLDSATTMIETTDGFYRVFGRVDIAPKGAKVTIQKESRGLFNIKWLCLSGKQYQMTQ